MFCVSDYYCAMLQEEEDKKTSAVTVIRRFQTICDHLMANRSPLTTHVLDAVKGQPAAGMNLQLHRHDPNNGAWSSLFVGATDADGRCAGMIHRSDFTAGTYKLSFDTDGYFASQNVEGFYPLVEIAFRIGDTEKRHYHVPLLLSPYAYSTYRGS